jgi:hypothetical protein
MSLRMLIPPFFAGVMISLLSMVISVYPCGAFLQTAPRLLSWTAISRLSSDEFANSHIFLAFGLSALFHGILCLAGVWLLDFIARRAGVNPQRAKPAVLMIVPVVYAMLVFLAWPVKDCP